jgi:2-keto-myo-inositol isomerase
MAIAMARYALNHIIAPKLDLPGFLDLARSIGISHLEIRNDIVGQAILDGTAPETVKALAASAGVEIVSINALQRFNEWNDVRANEAEALADYAQRAGVRHLVLVPVNDGSGRANGERQGNLRNALKQLAPILADHGLTGLVEPLGFEICSLRSKREAVEAIVALHQGDRFKLVHDTFHHFLAGEDDFFPEQTGLVHVSGVTDTTIGTSAMLDAHRVLVTPADRLGNLVQISRLNSLGYRGLLSFEPFAETVQSDPDIKSSLMESIDFINRHVSAD